jgi:general secretion pathway protein J
MLYYYKYKNSYKNIQKIRFNGFTLIEVMIALFIFAILSILTMRGMQTTFAAKQKSRQALDRLAELEIAYSIIQRDIEQIINRNVLQPSGGFKLALLVPIDNTANEGLKASLNSESGYNRLEFTRTGIVNTLIDKKVSDLQRVAYFQKDKMIVRHSWRQIDPTPDTLVDKRRLLTNVERFEIFFVDQYGRKTDSWEMVPSKLATQSFQPVLELPRGIVFNFLIKDYGEIEWVFSLATVLNRIV